MSDSLITLFFDPTAYSGGEEAVQQERDRFFAWLDGRGDVNVDEYEPTAKTLIVRECGPNTFRLMAKDNAKLAARA